MTIAYFVTFIDPQNPAARVSERDLARAVEIVKTTPKLKRGLVFTPEETRDPYAKDPPSPPLAFELYFADIADLEAALAPTGHLQALAARDLARIYERIMDVMRSIQKQEIVSEPSPSGRETEFDSRIED